MILFAFLTPYILEFLNLPFQNEGYSPNWLVSCLFLENYKMMLTNDYPGISPLRVMWSLCIEEHFYILWGLIIYFISIKRIPELIITSIFVANISRVIYGIYSIETLDILTNIDFFAYGAIPAYFLIKRNDLIEKTEAIPLNVKYLFAAMIVITVFTISNIKLPFLDLFEPTILGVLFFILILFTLPEKNKILLSKKLTISKLGKYTYGLYLYHTINISFLLQFYKVYDINIENILNNIFLILSALFLSILISFLSFFLFENQFIKLKKYFY